MRQIKSERLKKLETELADLEQWLKLGLVPKKDITKHKEEIEAVRAKMEEELARLRFLKESGDLEEYAAPKKATGRTGFTELPTIPDVDMTETAGMTETGFDMATDTTEGEETATPEGQATGEETESPEETFEDTYGKRNRWNTDILDPDADEW